MGKTIGQSHTRIDFVEGRPGVADEMSALVLFALVVVTVAMDRSSGVVKMQPGLDGYRMTEFDLQPPLRCQIAAAH